MGSVPGKRVVLAGNCPGGEFSWWGIVLEESCPDWESSGWKLLGWEFSWWGVALVGSHLSGDSSCWGIVRVRVIRWGITQWGSCPDKSIFITIPSSANCWHFDISCGSRTIIFPPDITSAQLLPTNTAILRTTPNWNYYPPRLLQPRKLPTRANVHTVGSCLLCFDGNTNLLNFVFQELWMLVHMLLEIIGVDVFQNFCQKYVCNDEFYLFLLAIQCIFYMPVTEPFLYQFSPIKLTAQIAIPTVKIFEKHTFLICNLCKKNNTLQTA